MMIPFSLYGQHTLWLMFILKCLAQKLLKLNSAVPFLLVKATSLNLKCLDNNKSEYYIEGFKSKFKKISYLKSNKKVSYKKTKTGLHLILDKKEINSIDTILKMEL